jgi:hypothetical protein
MNHVIFLIVHCSYTALAPLLRFAIIRSQVTFQWIILYFICDYTASPFGFFFAKVYFFYDLEKCSNVIRFM